MPRVLFKPLVYDSLLKCLTRSPGLPLDLAGPEGPAQWTGVEPRNLHLKQRPGTIMMQVMLVMLVLGPHFEEPGSQWFTRELVTKADSQALNSDLLNLELWGWGPAICVLAKSR